VRVQWTRQDDLGWDPKGPPQMLDMRGALDASGKIAAWETTAWLPANTPGLPAVPLLAPAAAGKGQPQGMSSGAIQLNADPPYAIPHMRTVIRWLKDTPLRPASLRAPGKIGNSLAVECFTDELAAAAGADPLQFRRQRLSDPRAIAVLDSVAKSMAWQPRPSPGPVDPTAKLLRGRGVSYVHYKQMENYVAMGMEVEVERATGIVRVTRVVCAHDCGLMINPDGTRAQIEGSILQTLSRTLFEEVTFTSGRVTSTDWSSYRLLTFPEVPKLEINLIDRPHEKPVGVGEPSTAPVAAAVGNAVFDATGVRLRTVPFTPARVKAALGQA
jgi:CO/xanthine dehydrogenase Mo-binding subunit